MPVDLNEDRMLAAARVMDAANRLGSRSQQAAFQQAGLDLRERELQQQKDALDRQMEMRLKEFDLNRTQEARLAAKQASDLDQGIKKNIAAKALGDFASVYDPTDVDHRSKLDWYRNWAQGEGVTAQEVNQGLANADNKTAALDNQLAGLRATSGIQDWEVTQTPDGKRVIDIGATVAKSNYLKQELDKQAQTWTHNDRMLETALTQAQSSIADPAQRMGSAQIRAMVNENRRTLTDYQTVVGEGLFVPPEGFTDRFVKRSNPNAPTISNDQVGYAPVMYNRDALELDPAYLKARGYAVRIAGGEEPEFERDNTGKIVYETLSGGGQVAKIARWVDAKRATAIAEADKKQADAVSAQVTADFDRQFGGLGKRAAAASQIQNATQSSDPATRDAGQAEIRALMKSGGGISNAKQFVPVTNDK